MRKMNSNRKTAMTAGVLYLLTFVSIPSLVLYRSVHGQNYILGPGPDTSVIIGGILEIIVALTCIGSAVALYPVLNTDSTGLMPYSGTYIHIREREYLLFNNTRYDEASKPTPREYHFPVKIKLTSPNL